MDQAFAFAGSNAWRCKEILSVKELIQKIMQEYENFKQCEPVDSMYKESIKMFSVSRSSTLFRT
jgi:hypothetical protein